jgi:hypothetical protein
MLEPPAVGEKKRDWLGAAPLDVVGLVGLGLLRRFARERVESRSEYLLYTGAAGGRKLRRALVS